MVEAREYKEAGQATLSVLALSSRFDGLISPFMTNYHGFRFQYSLCRVVLMVLALSASNATQFVFFQYSLCRVVLMV